MAKNTEAYDQILAIIPLSMPLVLIVYLIGNPIPILTAGFLPNNDRHDFKSNNNESSRNDFMSIPTQLLAYLIVAICGYGATSRLVPHIKHYTLRKGICGKDLGKRGTATADIPIPEALGIVPGSVFLVCLILCLVGYATIHSNNSNNNNNDNDFSQQQQKYTPDNKMLDVNSALLSICFMLFLGFTDDVLDWPWRYKLILPTIASLPLLCCYNGSTWIVVPKQLRSLLWRTTTTTVTSNSTGITLFGKLLEMFQFITIDPVATGALVDLGVWYLLYMSMLAVFCTNAINIFAGINGLEAGQSYVIGCAILVHNLIEIMLLQTKDPNGTNQLIQNAIDNHLFSVMIMCSFLGTCLGLLKHNWYPASVFVGDTFCYFAGMTFAVVGILGHFSKTLLLFFIPQVINFLWSTPQLFHYVPCPRHRLPAYNPVDGLCHPSTFDCQTNEYKWLKVKPNDTKGINMTVLNLCLQIFGPMTERQLCITLLSIQILCCSFGFFCRYGLTKFFFDD